MWYRTYFNKISKTEFEKIKKLSFKEAFDKYSDDEWDDKDVTWNVLKPYHFWTEIFNFWKDYFDIGEEFDLEFKDKKVAEVFSESKIISKKDIENIIEIYRDYTLSRYTQLEDKLKLILWESEEKFRTEEIKEYEIENAKNLLKGFISEKKRNHTESYKHYNIEEWVMTNSWSYEFNIFELIRIYREYNPDTEIIFYYWY